MLRRKAFSAVISDVYRSIQSLPGSVLDDESEIECSVHHKLRYSDEWPNGAEKL